ncbi:MAG TPA: MGMT family protein [Thermomicrobiales bacterium]|jgi:methylated-DNA-protein-cysteine methyltransferase-like protein|nr:MGMT family protein [Thermomicrobiales bacterium]
MSAPHIERAGAPPSRSQFYERVFALVARIPYGRVTTYGSIARAVAHPRAARMVGWALHSSPKELGLPCHRVINRNGELTGRWHWGDPDLMRLLLEEEGVEFDAQERVDLRRFGWWPDREIAEDGGRNVEEESPSACRSST